MAMSFTYDYGHSGHGRGGIARVIANWTSDSCGDASGTCEKISGALIKAVTDPGSAAPTANYDITLTDPEGVDILGKVQSDLTNRHTSTTEEVYFLVLDAAGTPLAQSIHPVVCDPITFTVANAGDTKTGEIILYVKLMG